MIVAPLVAAVNAGAVAVSVWQLGDFGAGAQGVRLLWINALVGAGISAVLFLAGLGLCLRRPWGRSLCFLFFFAAALGFAYMAVNGKLAGYVGSAEAMRSGRGSVGEQRFLADLVPFAGPLSVLLVVFMLLPGTRAWARGEPLPQPYAGPGRTSFLAIASMALSLMLCLVFPPLLALPLGAISLRSIHRSGGRLRGLPFAWIGVLLPSYFFTTLVGFGLAIGVACLLGEAKLIGEGFQIVEMHEAPDYGDDYGGGPGWYVDQAPAKADDFDQSWREPIGGPEMPSERDNSAVVEPQGPGDGAAKVPSVPWRR